MLQRKEKAIIRMDNGFENTDISPQQSRNTNFVLLPERFTLARLPLRPPVNPDVSKAFILFTVLILADT